MFKKLKNSCSYVMFILKFKTTNHIIRKNNINLINKCLKSNAHKHSEVEPGPEAEPKLHTSEPMP